MKKCKMMTIAVLAAVLFLVCGCSNEAEVTITASEQQTVTGEVADKEAEPATEPVTKEELQAEPIAVWVHICGAVQSPGVYEFTEADRICHAVAKAGGFTEDADEDYLNQAIKLSDGMRIYVPTKEETESIRENNLTQSGELLQKQDGNSGKININTATLEQLCTLPGIGEGKAQNIIAYRTEKGGYGSIEEIMNVEGIKEGLFEKIRDKITVS